MLQMIENVISKLWQLSHITDLLDSNADSQRIDRAFNEHFLFLISTDDNRRQ